MRSVVRYTLTAIPLLMLVGAVPFVNRVEPRVAGLPFLLAWLVFWVLSIPIFYSAADRMRNRT